MKAVVCTKYGTPDVLELQEIDTPTISEDEILVKVAASTVTAGDYRIRGLNVPFGFKFIMKLMFGFKKPKMSVLGSEYCGTVESVGTNVTEFNTGDEVFGISGMTLGSNAEYIRVPMNSAITKKPSGISVQEAAAIPFGATTSLFFLRDQGKIKAGQKVMIYGASSGVGVAAVQLAKKFGADVTAVCSKGNHQLMKSIGADTVIDYKTEDFTAEGAIYDIVLEVVGKVSTEQCLKVLKKGGTCLLVSSKLSQLLLAPWQNIFSGRRVKGGVTPERKEDMELIKTLIEQGSLKAVVDSAYPLENTAKAHAYAELGHKKGSLVITVGE